MRLYRLPMTPPSRFRVGTGSWITLSEDDMMDRPIVNGDDVFEFFSRFEFWAIQRGSSGKTEIVVRGDDRNYLKVWTRKNESVLEATERLRLKVDEVE